MKKITEEEAVALLKKYSNSEDTFKLILAHVKTVQRIAIRIASTKKNVNMYKIKIGSLLHDIGRFSCPPGKDMARHGVIGAEILRKEGLSDIAMIAERHLGAGIPKEDVIKERLSIPVKDYLPVSIEEKIIAHADNLTSGDKEIGFAEALIRFRKEIGEECANRLVELKSFIDNY